MARVAVDDDRAGRHPSAGESWLTRKDAT
jgi:hypothetical protein